MDKPRCGGAGCGGGTVGAIRVDLSSYPTSLEGDFTFDRSGPLEVLQAGKDVRDYNVGGSDYAAHKIQPWDIWKEYNLNPWDADIIKRVLRDKEGDSRQLDYEKIKHICDERIRQLNEEKA